MTASELEREVDATRNRSQHVLTVLAMALVPWGVRWQLVLIALCAR